MVSWQVETSGVAHSASAENDESEWILRSAGLLSARSKGAVGSQLPNMRPIGTGSGDARAATEKCSSTKFIRRARDAPRSIPARLTISAKAPISYRSPILRPIFWTCSYRLRLTLLGSSFPGSRDEVSCVMPSSRDRLTASPPVPTPYPKYARS